MTRLKYLSLFLLFALPACTTTGPDTTLVAHEEASKPTLDLREGGRLNLTELWPLTTQGVYLQRLTMALDDGTEYTFSIHLTLSSHSIEAIGFHEIYGRLYHLTLTPRELKTEISPSMEGRFNPEDILVDFLFSHVPHEKLQSLTNGVQIHKSSAESRTILRENAPIRKISRSRSLSPWMWETIVLENLIHGYTLHVETVEQS